MGHRELEFDPERYLARYRLGRGATDGASHAVTRTESPRCRRSRGRADCNRARDSQRCRRTVTVTVQGRTADSSLNLTLHNWGAPIEARHLPHLFERFFTTDKDGTGTGLGLAIVATIARSGGGRVAVQSSAEQGTSFTLSLPAPT